MLLLPWLFQSPLLAAGQNWKLTMIYLEIAETLSAILSTHDPPTKYPIGTILKLGGCFFSSFLV
jgi:hypothetical protein